MAVSRYVKSQRFDGRLAVTQLALIVLYLLIYLVFSILLNSFYKFLIYRMEAKFFAAKNRLVLKIMDQKPHADSGIEELTKSASFDTR